MIRHHPRPVIDVAELRAMLEEHEPVTVLDVRTAEDRAEWAIPGSTHVDAYEALKAGDPAALAELRPDARHQLCVFHVLKELHEHVRMPSVDCAEGCLGGATGAASGSGDARPRPEPGGVA